MLNSTLLISSEFNIILIDYNWTYPQLNYSNIDEDIKMFFCFDDIYFTENKADLYCMYLERSIYN